MPPLCLKCPNIHSHMFWLPITHPPYQLISSLSPKTNLTGSAKLSLTFPGRGGHFLLCALEHNVHLYYSSNVISCLHGCLLIFVLPVPSMTHDTNEGLNVCYKCSRGTVSGDKLQQYLTLYQNSWESECFVLLRFGLMINFNFLILRCAYIMHWVFRCC